MNFRSTHFYVVFFNNKEKSRKFLNIDPTMLPNGSKTLPEIIFFVDDQCNFLPQTLNENKKIN